MIRSAGGPITLLLCTTLLAACGGGDAPRTPGEMAQGGGSDGGGVTTLTGAGATFPFPIYSAWFAEYGRSNPVRVNYQSIGSGGGIRQITEGTVDFGASDAPMTAEERAKAPTMLEIPTVMGSVAVTYNLPGLQQPLRLDGETLSALFLGEIRRWNDPRIAALNPGVALPDEDVRPVTRTDGSGTTFVFTDYLAAVSPAWRERVGVGKSVRWPAGLGAKGNEGVTGQVRQTEGAVGYVELAYALQNDLAVAALRNAAGAYVTPSVESTSAAAADVADRLGPENVFTISLVNAPGAQAYPISTWTYVLVPRNMEECDAARALVGLLRWSVTEGGEQARRLHYAPLPDAVRERVLQKLGTITCGPDQTPAAPAAS